jgi:hypothetical protein
MKKNKVALQSILRTGAEEKNSQPLLTNLSIIRDDTTGRLIVDPMEVIAQVQKLEAQALSPYPTLPPGTPFPCFSHISPNHKHTIPIMLGCIIPAIMQEALRRPPSHKAAGPDGVPGMILKHMSPGIHEALQLLFQVMSIMGITPPSWLHTQPHHSLVKKGDPTTLDIYRTHDGHATCPSIICKNVSTFLIVDVHPICDTVIWAGNQISASITAKVPITMDKDGITFPATSQNLPTNSPPLGKLDPLVDTNTVVQPK